MNLFDSNVRLDIATADPVWLAWSELQFRNAATQVTRAVACYHAYFPNVTLITPP